jgi:uncharacterized cupredoxin-like copper-binding protein
MASGMHMAMGDEAAFSLDVPPGEARTLVYFPRPRCAVVRLSCPGHYAAGMRGTITVKNT